MKTLLENPSKKTAYMRKWRTVNVAKNKEYQAEYFKKYSTFENKERAIARATQYYLDNKKEILQSRFMRHRLKKYGLTIEQFEELLEKQNYVCAICMGTCQTGQVLSVDHDHETGKVRGLLCRKCNSAIGLLMDSPELLDAAKVYLIFYK